MNFQVVGNIKVFWAKSGTAGRKACGVRRPRGADWYFALFGPLLWTQTENHCAQRKLSAYTHTREGLFPDSGNLTFVSQNCIKYHVKI